MSSGVLNDRLYHIRVHCWRFFSVMGYLPFMVSNFYRFRNVIGFEVVNRSVPVGY